jgi:hypothetical protein
LKREPLQSTTDLPKFWGVTRHSPTLHDFFPPKKLQLIQQKKKREEMADEYERAPLLSLKGSVRADESAKYKKVGVAAALLFGASVLFSGKEQSSRFTSSLLSGYFSKIDKIIIVCPSPILLF